MADAERRRKDRWGSFLLIWALVLLLLGAACCFVLYQYLAVYEKTRPEPVVDAWLNQNDAEQLLKAAQENVRLDVSEFEDASDLFAAYLSTVDTSRPLTYRLSSKDSSDEQLVYIIYCGNKEICSLMLKPEDSSPGFGRHSWTVSEVRSAPITEILPSLHVVVDAVAGEELFLNGRPLGDLIRRHEISDYASRVSAIPEVRAFLLETQRETARNGGTIMDGRDIGTVILPDADVKIFLSASVEKRAERRYKELIERGDSRPYEDVLADIRERDERDSSRDTAPLRPADDAVFFDNSEIGLDESVEVALEIIKSKTRRRGKRCGKR